MAPRPRSKKQVIVSSQEERRPFLIWSIVIPVLLIIGVGIWHYREGIKYYVRSIFSSTHSQIPDDREADARNIFLMSQHEKNTFGIDISQYQGHIVWDSIQHIYNQFPVDFVFIRATMGEKAKDKEFKNNWRGASARAKIKGAYHYYRPNENSLKQAQNFIRRVKLQPGDLPPVLDIEELPRRQSLENLRKGLRRWLHAVEQHYGIKPIIYSGDSYHTDFLEKEFPDYALWIANYNFWIETPKEHWDFWQFSEKGKVSGIAYPVDLNMFKGGIEELEELCIPF